MLRRERWTSKAPAAAHRALHVEFHQPAAVAKALHLSAAEQQARGPQLLQGLPSHVTQALLLHAEPPAAHPLPSAAFAPPEPLTVPQLKRECVRRGLRGYSRLRKAELIALLRP